MELKVKFFGSANPFKISFLGKESLTENMEKEINIWLTEKSNIEIVDIRQSAAGGSLKFIAPKLFVSVWYKDNT